MKISVIGCGYLGAVHAACLASVGHHVVGIDVDATRVAALNNGVAPFYEPGIDSILTTALAEGRLSFSTDMRATADADLHYLAVGTPQSVDSGAADVSFLDAALDALLPVLTAPSTGAPVVIAGKSTVPVGTAARLAQRIATEAATPATLVWNPEFLREGHAISDTLSPDRMVYGLPSDPAGARVARSILDAVFSGEHTLTCPVVATDYATAELVKSAANSFLATKVSFINAMAQLCAASGADVSQLAQAIGYDVRIGSQYLRAGVGYGGGCIPKDVRALVARAQELGASEAVDLLQEVDQVNLRQRERIAALVTDAVGGDLQGARIAVLGASFKPDSDDIRDSPALAVARLLHERGAVLQVTDPHAGDNVRRAHPELGVADSIADAAAGADVVVLLTEWREFVDIDPVALGAVVRQRRVVDGRNALVPQRWREAGWSYAGVGRP